MGKNKENSNKYLQIARKYLDLIDKFYYEFDSKASSEAIFENNFKYEISLLAFGFNFLISLNQNNDSYIALLARKIIEDYYLYKLKDTKYLTHSNFKLFKIASCKEEVGTRALQGIVDEFHITPNVIKSRMFDNGFWLFGNNFSSLEELFSKDYEDFIKESLKELHHRYYKGYGILIHYKPEIRYNLSSSYELINKLSKEILKEDYDKCKNIKNNFDDLTITYKNKILKEKNKIDIEIMDFYNSIFLKMIDNGNTSKNDFGSFLYFRNISIILEFLTDFGYLYHHKLTRPISIMLIKPFIETLSYNYELLNELDCTKACIINAFYSEFININVKSLFENKSINEYLYIYSNDTFRKLYDNCLKVKNNNITYEEFIDKYKETPYKLINEKYTTFNAFVTHFIDTFNKSKELKRLYKESLTLTHSYGLIQNHEFNYKKTLLDLIDVSKTYLNYFYLIILTRDFNGVNQKENHKILEESISKINIDINNAIDLIKKYCLGEINEENNISNAK